MPLLKDSPIKADTPFIQSKVVVLHSLSTFLQSALSSSVHLPSSSALDQFSMRSWYLAPSFARPEAYVSFEELLQPAQQRSTDCDCRTWQAEVDLEDDKFIHHHTSIWPQPYLDNVSDDVGITEAAQVDGSNINYTFIAVWFLWYSRKALLTFLVLASEPKITCVFGCHIS